MDEVGDAFKYYGPLMKRTSPTDSIREKFEAARDRSILAAILCGSLSHDRVWEKYDIDLITAQSNKEWVAQGEETCPTFS